MTDLWLLVILLSLGGLSVLSYALRALDLLGAVASFFLGLEVALLSDGVRWLALMTLFPVLGVIATRIGRRRKQAARLEEEREGERGVGNVLGNGLAAALVTLALLLDVVPHKAVALGFATAVAAVTADTLASEIGVLAARARSILPPFAPARVGDNGAVSLLGQAAALVGALAIASASVPLLGLGLGAAAIVAVAGFAGCQVDSVLGATLEGNKGDGRLNKQDVNFLAAALPAFLVLVVGAILL